MEKKFLFIFGTRPELIKIFPLYLELKKKRNVKVKVCFTGQHKSLILDIIKEFKIKIDYNLKSLNYCKNLNELISFLSVKLKKIIEKVNPNTIIVQGDTVTTFTGAIAGFLLRKKIAYLESGLRTYQKYSPFPEEIFRQNVSRIADFNFCPTKENKTNLIKENINKNKIFVTGNTIVDAIELIKKKIKEKNKNTEDKYFLVTLHRRELTKSKYLDILKAIDFFSKKNKIKCLYILHENPKFKKNVIKFTKSKKNFKLLSPMNYINFVSLAIQSQFIITDSGGISEEGPSLRKKIFIARDKTERPEILSSNYVSLISTNPKKILKNLSNLKKSKIKKNSRLNPVGDGKSAKKICNILMRNN